MKQKNALNTKKSELLAEQKKQERMQRIAKHPKLNRFSNFMGRLAKGTGKSIKKGWNQIDADKLSKGLD